MWRNFLLAHRSYEIASKLNPNHYGARYGLALMKHLLGRVGESVVVYFQALALRPQSFEANHHVAAALLQLGRAPEAVNYGKRAVELQRHHQGAWANLGAAYNLTGHYDQAVDAYRRAVEFGDPAEPILQGLAYAHMMLRRYDRAIVVLRDQNPHEPSALASQRLGYCHFKLQQFEQSLASYRTALSINPDDTLALNGAAISLMALQLKSEENDDPKHRDVAIRLWRRSVRLRDDQPLIHALIARYTVAVASE